MIFNAHTQGRLVWTEQTKAAFEYCQLAVSNCQELYFLEDTDIPILQIDASDYGVGGYMFTINQGKVRVTGFPLLLGGFKVKMFRNKTARFAKQTNFCETKQKMFDGFS